MRRTRSRLALAGLLAASAPAEAHPHIWIDYGVTLVFRGGDLAALRLTWTFDAMYSALLRADAGSRGETLSPEHVERLRKEAFANLAGYEYFLVVTLDGERLKIPEADSFDARIVAGRVVYDFSVPLDPHSREPSLDVSVVDSEYYVAFTLQEKDPVRQEGGAAQCEVARAQRRGPFDLVGADVVTCRWQR